MTANLATASITATGSSESRTLGDRFAEVINVKDFGAVGDSFADDTVAIEDAFVAMYATSGAKTLYFPPGTYKVTSSINIAGSISNGVGAGRIVGDGVSTTVIQGTIDDGFVFNFPYQTNGAGEISDMSIKNFSSYIGTGALRFANGNAKGFLHNLQLGGLVGLDCGWNVFNTTVIGLLVEGNGLSVCPYGSIGILSGAINLQGARGAASHEIGLTMVGNQASAVSGISFEETPIGVALGLYVGFGTATITGANGSKKLTVTGELYPPAASTATPLQNGDLIVTSGVDPTVNPSITITAQDSGTGGEQGVYSLSGADNVTISTPQPIQIRRRWGAGPFTLSNYQTEGCGVGIYVLGAGGGTISGVYTTGTVAQGINNQYGGVLNTTNTCSPYCGIYIEVAGAMTIEGCTFGQNAAKAAVLFAPGSVLSRQLVFNGIQTNAAAGGVSDANAFIDNGAGTTLVTNAATPVATMTVSGAVAGTAGVVRLTVNSTATAATGNPVIVSGVGGTTEANGSWTATVVSGTLLELQGSTFANTYTSGGTVIANYNVLHFAGGTIPGSVVAGVPVYSVTTPGNIPIYSRVSSVNNGAGTVTLNQNTNGVASSETIKFCVPSAVAGNVLTVQTITTTLGRATTVWPACCMPTVPHGGFAVQGVGVPTGSNTPMISDQVNGYGPATGGLSYAQYTLVKSDGSAVSLNVGPEVFTFVGGKKWGIDNLTGLSGIGGNTKAGISINPNTCDNDSTLDMLYADLPGQSGVYIDTPILGMEFIITDGQKSGTGTAVAGDTVQGGASQKLKVAYNGSVWKCVAALT